MGTSHTSPGKLNDRGLDLEKKYRLRSRQNFFLDILFDRTHRPSHACSPQRRHPSHAHRAREWACSAQPSMLRSRKGSSFLPACTWRITSTNFVLQTSISTCTRGHRLLARTEFPHLPRTSSK